MTEAELDRVHDLRERIEKKVVALVNKMLTGETPAVDDLVRTQLTENFRFWKT